LQACHCSFARSVPPTVSISTRLTHVYDLPSIRAELSKDSTETPPNSYSSVLTLALTICIAALTLGNQICLNFP
jgi:hypothetical protein